MTYDNVRKMAMHLREVAYKQTHDLTAPAWADVKLTSEECHEIANTLDELAKASETLTAIRRLFREAQP